MTKWSFAAAVLASLFVIDPPAYAEDLEQSGKMLLDQTLSVWTMASISKKVKAFVAERQAGLR
jgi:hypothetical protein